VNSELERAIGRPVSRETFETLQAYVALLREESQRQNLIAASTIEHFWKRHVLDSAQLARFEPFPGAAWVDIGAGAGLPGIVVACLVEGPVTLVEPRRLRAEFLHKVVDELRIRATIEQRRAEAVAGSFDVITARAVAALPKLLEISAHLSTRKSVWILPKGRRAEDELAQARRTWHGLFHVERSLTDDDSLIVVGKDVRARE
jgi:16S rRNA (guanine527-N7)-methyltransferase